MKHVFVINPSAGKGNKVNTLIETIKSTCASREVEYDIYVTTGVGDAERYIKEVLESRRLGLKHYRFYACGGDGTINECANGVAGYKNCELGFIPIGTGNDFVRNFGDKESFYNIEDQLDGVVTSCDLIKYNDRYCINVANIGLDCEVVVRTDLVKKNALVPSKLAYIVGLVGEFAIKKGIKFKCTVDGRDMGDRYMLLAFFANGGYYGGGFHAAPLSAIKDGYIDACFIKNVSRMTFLNLVGKYKNGTYLDIKNRDEIFEYVKCKKVELVFDKPEHVCVDGEVETLSQVSLEIVEEKINISIPKAIYVEGIGEGKKKEKAGV